METIVVYQKINTIIMRGKDEKKAPTMSKSKPASALLNAIIKINPTIQKR